MEHRVFLDTAYAISLSSEQDDFHEVAVQIADILEAERTFIVTTQAILLEIGNALSKQRFRHAAVALLQSLEADPSVEVVPFSQELYDLAFTLFRNRADKDWGLIDCVFFYRHAGLWHYASVDHRRSLSPSRISSTHASARVITASEQGAAPDRLQLRSLRSFLAALAALSAASEFGVLSRRAAS